MSSGRSFQAAAGIFKAAGRSGGYSAFNNVARSCFRVAGVIHMRFLCNEYLLPLAGLARLCDERRAFRLPAIRKDAPYRSFSTVQAH